MQRGLLGAAVAAGAGAAGVARMRLPGSTKPSFAISAISFWRSRWRVAGGLVTVSVRPMLEPARSPIARRSFRTASCTTSSAMACGAAIRALRTARR